MRYIFTLIFACAVFAVQGQASPLHQYKFRLYLKDKGAHNFSVENPEQFLSKQAVERKKRQNAPIDETDFPLSPDYFAQVRQAGGKVVSHSKWFKTMVVQVADSASIGRVAQLPFVDSVKYVWRGIGRPNIVRARPRLAAADYAESKFDDFEGLTIEQFNLHNAAQMAEAGFRGKGKRVAVIDAGFTNFDVIPLFKEVNLHGFRDFVPTGEIFSANDHGTRVLSTMAMNRPNLMMGSAPDAMYWLLRSEDVASEFPVEEDYWVRAVEYADSIGIDLINTSLGYNSFDDPKLSYTHAHLDGKTSFMSQAANRAFDKGILMVVSAGNEGNKQWGKTTPPGDAQNVLTVGAVDTDSVIAAFSSRGAIADGRLKPDVVSVGKATITVGYNGLIDFANGTSFSSPFLAGLTASLWSINPDLNRAEIMRIVKQSSDRYAAPDSVYGYGIPNFGKATAEVLKTLKINDKKVSDEHWNITPAAPNAYTVSLTNPEYTPDAYSATLLDEQGRILAHRDFEESLSVQFPLAPETKRANRFVHFVVNAPFVQRVYRVKL